MFDVNPKLIGLRINDIEVLDYERLEGFLHDNVVDIGIVCTNKTAHRRLSTSFAKEASEESGTLRRQTFI